MVERTVKRTIARWRPLALGAALGYVALLILTRWSGSRSRDRFDAPRNGFHPQLFV